MHFDGKMKNNRRKIERGLGILPYGNFIMRTVGKYGEFRPCVRTWAVLAILLFAELLVTQLFCNTLACNTLVWRS